MFCVPDPVLTLLPLYVAQHQLLSASADYGHLTDTTRSQQEKIDVLDDREVIVKSSITCFSITHINNHFISIIFIIP